MEKKESSCGDVLVKSGNNFETAKEVLGTVATVLVTCATIIVPVSSTVLKKGICL